MMNFQDMSPDVLLLIFRYCSYADKLNLYYVNRKFRDLLNHHVFRIINKDFIITSQNENNWMNKRTAHKFSYKQLCHLNHNIRSGKYEEKIFFKHPLFYVSCIHLDADYLYMSHKGQIRVHKRNRMNAKQELDVRPKYRVSSLDECDITSMRKRNNLIFAGRNNGHVFIYNIDSQVLLEEKVFENDDYINCVDFSDNFFVATSKKSTKFFNLDMDLGIEYFNTMFHINEPFQCIKIQPSNQYVAVGKYHDSSGRALRLIDIESGVTENSFVGTKAIYDLVWKDSNCVITGNFDTTLRLTDIRSNCDTQIWEDPYDASVYCLDYDGMNGIFCGMKYHHRVNLYDLRFPKKVVQMYFPRKLNFNQSTSPAYAVASDCSELFIVTDHSLRILNFRTNYAEERDYST